MQATEPITALAIETGGEGLKLILAGRQVLIPWEKCSKRLANATPAERQNPGYRA